MNRKIKSKTLFILTLVSLSFFASCQQDDAVYSCNPDADTWAKNNISAIRNMTRTEWLNIENPDNQRAAFIAFTPNQKQTLWIEKLEEVLSLEWTDAEKQHLQSALNLIKNNEFIYSPERNQDDFEKFEIELYRWTEYARETLGWDDKLLSALIATPKAINADKKVVSPTKSKSPRLKNSSESSKPSCTCSITSDWCDKPFHCADYDYECKSSVIGCGSFLAFSCNGMCSVLIL